MRAQTAALYLATSSAILLLASTPAQTQTRVLQAERNDGTSILEVTEDAALVVRGTVGTGALPVAGAGTRLVWFPAKAALRAGAVDGSQWDASNIGVYSIALGDKPIATGEASAAIGREASATAARSTAIGFASLASGAGSTAIGGSNTATGVSSTALGVWNVASGQSAMALGQQSTASGQNSVAIGTFANADGRNSTAIGMQVTASGDYSVALGRLVSTDNRVGSFVFGDNSAVSAITNATAANQFMVRAGGGTIFYSNAALTAGVSLAPGAGAWASVSDRERKENFRDLDGEEVLTKIRALPVPQWNYRSQDASVRRVGPMAQDFRAAFGLGDDDRTITTTDISGVNMLAIQALERRTADLEAVRAELRQARAELAALRQQTAQVATLLDQVNALRAELRQTSVERTAAPPTGVHTAGLD